MQPASPTPVAAHVRASKAEVTGALNTLDQCWDNTSSPCGAHSHTLSGRRGGSGGNNLRGAELLLGRALHDGVLRLLREEDVIVSRALGEAGECSVTSRMTIGGV